MKRLFVFLAALVVPAIPILLAACKHDTAASEPAPTGRGSRGARGGDGGGLTYPVDIFQVDKKQLDYIVTAPATMEAFERVQVTARVTGVVDRVTFVEGQEVKQGDVLLVIDSERFKVALNAAQAALEKAKASQVDSEAQVARREGAMQQHPGLITGEELATYRTKTLTAKADTSVAEQNVKVAELNLRDSAVRAPIGGVIQTRTVETGQYINTGTIMATLLRQDPMLLRFQVEPQDAPRLKPGMAASFTMRETQRTFEAKISLVSASADATTHMVEVTATVIPGDHKYWLRPGVFCDVSIDVGATRDSPVIPRFATRATDHGYVTYVVANDIAEERVITLGMNTRDGWVEVRSGLNGGESIVVHGADALSTGAHVKSTRLTSLDAGAAPADSSAHDQGAPPGASSGEAHQGGRRGREAGAGPGSPLPTGTWGPQ